MKPEPTRAGTGRKPGLASGVVRAALGGLAVLLLTACASSGHEPVLPAGVPARVLPVKNLAGVTLNVPELYMGDAGEKAAGLEIELIDLRLLAEAGLRAHLRNSGRDADTGRHELHGAISVFEMTELRRTGRIRLGLAAVLVDSETQKVLAQTEVVQDCQLLDQPPAETGIIGEQRFIRRRLEVFMQGLTTQAMLELGF
ncbi:MAG: hypothetical protein KF696_08260 [Planctomycetes bacterium]|nr:hypothetical protein [Planctomycetota bacterium]MCW8135656.1 hypothetical protein [Planctomycetota bacterium]